MISRNAPCPCGSGKKYKRCCINKKQNTNNNTEPLFSEYQDENSSEEKNESQKPSSNMKNEILSEEIRNVVEQLNESQLIALHNLTVDRLRIFQKARRICELSKFNYGDKVSFEHQGSTVFGTIIRLNQKTSTIMTDDMRQWNVTPVLLRKIKPTK